MNYYENVVIEYLRADRAVFINTECCIQLNPGNPDNSGPHWYCDSIALDFRSKMIFLVEISYASRLSSLRKRLFSWHENWENLCSSVYRDCCLNLSWPIQPWLFIPQHTEKYLDEALALLKQSNERLKFDPKKTILEDVQPWKYKSWDRNPT